VTPRRAFIEVLFSYLAGVFMFSAIGSVAILFIAGVVADTETTTARLPYVAGVAIFVAVLLATRFQFRVRYRLKIAGKRVKTSEPIPQEWIDLVSNDRDSPDT
jgi:hypothetical protein